MTLGHGHDEAFWRAFCQSLRGVGYDDVLSIEHEDAAMNPVEAVAESIDRLNRVMVAQPV